MSAWYLLHCKARQEARAKLNIENQGYEAFCPMINIEKRIAGKRKVISEPLFPNYVFISLDPETANFNALRSTRGVNGFVRFGGVPSSIPERVVAQLKAAEDLQQEKPADTMFKSGAQVEITDGPFAGLHAIYQLPKGDDRCLVLLDMMGKQQEIEIEENKLTKR